MLTYASNLPRLSSVIYYSRTNLFRRKHSGSQIAHEKVLLQPPILGADKISWVTNPMVFIRKDHIGLVFWDEYARHQLMGT